jgi:hypothetical protein
MAGAARCCEGAQKDVECNLRLPRAGGYDLRRRGWLCPWADGMPEAIPLAIWTNNASADSTEREKCWLLESSTSFDRSSLIGQLSRKSPSVERRR